MYDQGPGSPQFKFNNLFDKHFYYCDYFFLKDFSCENWRGGDGL